MLVVGLGASVLAAFQWRGYIGDQQARQVTTTTATTSASLSAALQRDEDLVETLRGVVASGATVTNPQLEDLYMNVGGTDNAGVIGLVYIELVPYRYLGGFEAQVAADPPLGRPESASSSGLVANDGVRPQYCLIRLAAASTAAAKDLSPAGTRELTTELSDQYDYCSGQYAPFLSKSAATGRQDVTSFDETLASTPGQRKAAGVPNSLFDIAVPVYVPGAPLATTAERAQALLGWTSGLFSPLPVLAPIVGRSAGLAITLSYVNSTGTTRLASAGPSLSHASDQTVRLSADGHWVARISVVPSDVSATVQGIGVLADLFVIVLLVALILSLFRSRKHALASVENKNQELLHRSLHDTLTGLPNRELMLDWTETMLESEREEPVAALLIDLDDFNAINDTYGHRFGDELLKSAARSPVGLARSLRHARPYGRRRVHRAGQGAFDRSGRRRTGRPGSLPRYRSPSSWPA